VTDDRHHFITWDDRRDNCTCSRSRKKFKWFMWTCPFQKWLAIRGLTLATLILPTNFESLYLHRSQQRYNRWYKMSKMGWFGVTGTSAIRQSAYEILLVFHSNYVPILHRVWDTARYWSKIVDCNLPHLYLATSLERPHWNFAEIFGFRKLESQCYRIALFARSQV